MEWLKKILEGAVVTDGKIDVEGLSKSIGEEMAKHTVTKDVYDDMKGKYETANNALKNYDNVDITKLQQELEDEKTARANDKKEFLFKQALKEAGAVDTDYLLFKHGLDNVTLDDKGELQDWDKTLKSMKETYKTQFQEVTPGSTGTTGNFGKPPEKQEKELSLGERLGKAQAENNQSVVDNNPYFK